MQASIGRGFLAALLGALLPAHQVVASVIEPDDYAVGTELSTIMEGVRLSAITARLTDELTSSGSRRWEMVYGGAVYAALGSPSKGAATGTNVLGYKDANGVMQTNWGDLFGGNCLYIASPCESGFPSRVDAFLQIEFLTPASSFAAYVTYNGGDPAGFLSFDSDKNLLSSVQIWPMKFSDGTTNRYKEFPGPPIVGPFGPIPDPLNAWLSYSEDAGGSASIHTRVFGGWDRSNAIDRISWDEPAQVPEPGTLALLLMGLVAVAARDRGLRERLGQSVLTLTH
jgi:hypothetical protein